MVEIGDKVQPHNLRGIWEVVGFVPSGMNDRYKVVLFHEPSNEQVELENLPHNTRTPPARDNELK